MRLFRILRLPALVIVLASALVDRPCLADKIVDFDDLSLAPQSYWNGPDPGGTIVDGPYGDVNLGKFSSHDVRFVNRFDLTFQSWSGFAYSNTTDTTTPGFMNQFSAITGSGRGAGADNYGVAFGYKDIAPNLFDPVPFDPTDAAQLIALPYFEIPDDYFIEGMYVTNTTYAALSMQYGDGFAKAFGGPTGNDPDWFKLTAYGTDANGQLVPGFVEFYLADFRFEDNTLDYILTDWTHLDLSPLADARRIHFNLSSSDVGDFGMNIPAYFAVDDIQLRVIPEPSSLILIGIGTFAAALRARSRRRVS